MMVPQELADTVVDPSAYAESERIDEAFRWLRREAPLAKIQPRDHDPFWAVTRHADIQTVERLNELFHNGDRATNVASVEADRAVRELMGGSPHLLRTLVQMDGPDHFAYRRLTQAAFLPQNLRSLEGRIREIAREFVDRMAAYGERCDFARDIAFLYPLRVLMELMGVPQSDEPTMLRLTQEMFGNTDPDLNRSGAEQTPSKNLEDLYQTLADFKAYFGELAKDRRRCPKEDLASVIANGQVDGKPLGELELLSYFIIVATAGHDTTSNATAGGLGALAANPDQFAKLKANPALIPGLVEESIRWETPVKHFMRTATADTELSGQRIAQGDWLMLCYASGNRDEAVFDEPYRFNIERTPNKHVAFGYGAHVCLGQHLGRMEMRIFWEELLPRLQSLELDGAVTRWKATFVSGPKTVPIRFAMQKAAGAYPGSSCPAIAAP